MTERIHEDQEGNYTQFGRSFALGWLLKVPYIEIDTFLEELPYATSDEEAAEKLCDFVVVRTDSPGEDPAWAEQLAYDRLDRSDLHDMLRTFLHQARNEALGEPGIPFNRRLWITQDTWGARKYVGEIWRVRQDEEFRANYDRLHDYRERKANLFTGAAA